MKNIICFLVLFSQFVLSQDGWRALNTNTTKNLNSIFFTNPSTGFAVGDTGTIIKTTNAGASWQSYPTGINDWLVAVHFPSASTGYAIGVNQTLLKTTNGGTSWAAGSVNSLYSNYSVFFVNDLTGFVASGHFDIAGAIIKTTDGGSSWNSSIIAPEPLFYVYFINTNTGYASGGDFEYGTEIYKTTNGGLNWIKQSPEIFGILRSMYFTQQNPLLGFAVGLFGVILRTTDGSLTWTQHNIPSGYSLTSVHFPDVNTGYVCGYDGLAGKTINSGLNWVILYSGTKQSLKSIFFTDPNTGYVAGDRGVILKTTNGGVTPTYTISGIIRYQDNGLPVASGKVKALKYDPFSNEIMTVDSAVIQSNGSYTLPHVPKDSVDIMAFQDDEESASFVPTYYVSTIKWENSMTLYPAANMTGIDINVFRNLQGTDNWHIGGNVSASGTALTGLNNAYVYAKSGNLYKGYSVSVGSGDYSINKLSNGTYEVIVDRLGYYGTQASTTLNNSHINDFNFSLENYLIGIEKNVVAIPSEFTLFQNYPNPFNPQTGIHFGLPKESLVRLVIFDLLGREIAVLADGQYKAGEYSVRWNSEGFSSGIYFYRFTAGGYTESKKMILVR